MGKTIDLVAHAREIDSRISEAERFMAAHQTISSWEQLSEHDVEELIHLDVNRLDGVGAFLRKHRPPGWQETTKRLKAFYDWSSSLGGYDS